MTEASSWTFSSRKAAGPTTPTLVDFSGSSNIDGGVGLALKAVAAAVAGGLPPPLELPPKRAPSNGAAAHPASAKIEANIISRVTIRFTVTPSDKGGARSSKAWRGEHFPRGNAERSDQGTISALRTQVN